MVDCSDEPAINTAMAAIFEEHGKIDILVNNASHPLHLPITNPSQFPSYSQAGLIMRKPATETTAPEWLGVLSDHNGHTCLSSCEPAFARYYGHQPQWSILLGKRSSAVHGVFDLVVNDDVTNAGCNKFCFQLWRLRKRTSMAA